MLGLQPYHTHGTVNKVNHSNCDQKTISFTSVESFPTFGSVLNFDFGQFQNKIINFLMFPRLKRTKGLNRAFDLLLSDVYTICIRRKTK